MQYRFSKTTAIGYFSLGEQSIKKIELIKSDIEKDDFDYSRIKRILARNAQEMTDEDKRGLINALFGEE